MFKFKKPVNINPEIFDLRFVWIGRWALNGKYIICEWAFYSKRGNNGINIAPWWNVPKVIKEIRALEKARKELRMPRKQNNA